MRRVNFVCCGNYGLSATCDVCLRGCPWIPGRKFCGQNDGSVLVEQSFATGCWSLAGPVRPRDTSGVLSRAKS